MQYPEELKQEISREFEIQMKLKTLKPDSSSCPEDTLDSFAAGQLCFSERCHFLDKASRRCSSSWWYPARKGSAAMAELCKRKVKMSKHVCMWKPVLQHFHTCLLEMMKT